MSFKSILSPILSNEKVPGILLILCTVFSLLIANSAFGDIYHHFWTTMLPLGSIEFWINDGLMAVFFLYVGLELKKEIYTGELSNVKAALLPVFAAIGGVLVPAFIYVYFNHDTTTAHGWGIPMATDIAFALGILSLLGNRVPLGLKVFLTALAVIDDLMAILVIGFFYTSNFNGINLLISLGILTILFVLGKRNVNHLWLYLILGCFAWYFMLQSGVHATIAGVLLAFTIPFDKIDTNKSLSAKLEHSLAKPVSFIILPLFALANTAVLIDSTAVNGLLHNNALGIYGGLIIGKPLGIVLFSFFVISLGWCKLPNAVNWKHLFAVACLGGIGFTMSIFITNLAFSNQEDIVISKLAILISSTIAALLGYILLQFTLKNNKLIRRFDKLIVTCLCTCYKMLILSKF